MNNVDILVKVILLLIKEKQLERHNTENNSSNIAKDVIAYINNDRINVLNNNGGDIIENLVNLIHNILDENSGYDNELVLQSIVVIIKDNPSLVDMIKT